MLYITRKAGESIIINGDIHVKIVEIKGRTAKISFEFPPQTTVLREEVYERIRLENQLAAESIQFLKDEQS